MLITWGLTVPATIATAAAIYWSAGEIYKLGWVLSLLENWLSSG